MQYYTVCDINSHSVCRKATKDLMHKQTELKSCFSKMVFIGWNLIIVQTKISCSTKNILETL